MKNFTWAVLVTALLLSLHGYAQKATVKQQQIQLNAPGVVNFTQMAEYEKLHPVILPQRDVERDEDEKANKVIPNHKIDRGASVTKINTEAVKQAELNRTTSPLPAAQFDGLLDNNTVIPPVLLMAQ